jgi:ParB-like chromosome segregation protein Spo0J
MLKTVSVASLIENPWRRLDEYPILREKVDALKESIDSTGFWGTIVGREVKGQVEIAFGHHRVVALQELAIKKVEIIIRDLSNAEMIKMMARENMEEWSTSAWVELETIRTVIAAYGRGEIGPPDFPNVPRDTRKDLIRNVGQGSGLRSYTKATVAEFLGWTRKHASGLRPNFACETAFRAIDAIDRGFLHEDNLKGLSRSDMDHIVREQASIYQSEKRVAQANRDEAKVAQKRADMESSPQVKSILNRQVAILEAQAKQHDAAAKEKSKQFIQNTTPQLRNGNIGVRGVKEEAAKYKASTFTASQLVDVDGYARKSLIPLLQNILNDSNSKLLQDIALITEHVSDMSDSTRHELCQQFDALIGRASAFAAPFRGK